MSKDIITGVSNSSNLLSGVPISSDTVEGMMKIEPITNAEWDVANQDPPIKKPSEEDKKVDPQPPKKDK